MYGYHNGYYNARSGDRFFGGGFVPFVLGGIAGSLWSNNWNNRRVFYYPVFTPFSYQYYNFPNMYY